MCYNHVNLFREEPPMTDNTEEKEKTAQVTAQVEELKPQAEEAKVLTAALEEEKAKAEELNSQIEPRAGRKQPSTRIIWIPAFRMAVLSLLTKRRASGRAKVSIMIIEKEMRQVSRIPAFFMPRSMRSYFFAPKFCPA